jgi:hypothetical protein
VCQTHRLKVLPTFLIVDYGGLSILTARGRLRPEMKSPVDRATTVFYSCFVDIYRLSCTVSTLLTLFLSPQMVERRFRSLGGGVDQKLRHQSISCSRFGIGRLWNFASISYRSKVIRLFRFACASIEKHMQIEKVRCIFECFQHKLAFARIHLSSQNAHLVCICRIF